MRILHIGTKRKSLTKAGSPNIPVLVHAVATYDDFQGVTWLLCHYVLGCLHDVHARVDAISYSIS